MAGPTTAERGEHRRDDAAPSPAGGVPAPASPPARRGLLPRRRTLLAFAVLAALLGGAGTWALYGSEWLRVERVEVRWADDGPRTLTADQISRAARVPVDSPMVSLDTGAVSERLLDALPRVKSVEVSRGWPHTVSLKVTEREAVLLVPGAEGYTEVDDEGVPFARTGAALAGVPVVEMSLGDSPSRHRYGEERVLAATAAMAAALPPDLIREILTVRVTSYDAVMLELTDNRTVRWGSPEDTAAKARALDTLMKAAGGAVYFDVSVPSVPAASAG